MVGRVWQFDRNTPRSCGCTKESKRPEAGQFSSTGRLLLNRSVPRSLSIHGRWSRQATRNSHLILRNTAARVGTRTSMTPAEAKETHYALMASPTLFPGQTVRAGVK